MLTLYGHPLSPFVRKVIVALKEKGLNYEHVLTRPGETAPEYRAISPTGKIPAITDGDFSVPDSTAILVYLDGVAPNAQLYPSDVEDRARAVWFEEFGDTVLAPQAGAIFFNRVLAPRFLNQEGDQEAANKACEEGLPPLFDYLESQLEGRDFLVGDSFTVADLAILSPLINARYGGFEPDQAKWPNLVRWRNGILARDSVSAALAAEAETIPKAA